MLAIKNKNKGRRLQERNFTIFCLDAQHRRLGVLL